MVKNNNLNELFPTLEEGEKLVKLVESNKFIMEAVDKIKSVLKQKGKASAPVKAETMMMENNSDKPINLKLELTIPHNFPEPWLADVSNFLKLFKDGKLEELGAIVKKANGDMAHVVNLIESNKTLLQKTDALEEVLQAYEEKIKHRIQVIEKRGGILKQTLHLIGKTPTLFLSTVKAVASVLMINPAVVRDVSESVYYDIEFVEDLNALTRDIGKAAKKTVKKSVGKCFGHGAHVEAETPPIHMNEAANSNHTDIMDNQSHLRQEETAASLHA
jgi:DNA-dependent RNA polymerase auxiliary subunit epsilon